jgi:SAM-dependent methyltransferase
MKFNSIDYWETRYKNGGNSGLGSRGDNLEFKGKVINQLIEKYNIKSICDLGCGDGEQIKTYNIKKYIGLDVSKSTIDNCKNIFKSDKNKKFYVYQDFNKKNNIVDATISIDVMYHIIEEDIYNNYLNDLINISSKYIIIYSYNNFTNRLINSHAHIKHREFVETMKSKNTKLIEYIPNYQRIDDSDKIYADFYIFEKINNLK